MFVPYSEQIRTGADKRNGRKEPPTAAAPNPNPTGTDEPSGADEQNPTGAETGKITNNLPVFDLFIIV